MFIPEVLRVSPMIGDVQAQGVVQGVVPGHEVQYIVEVSSKVYFLYNSRVQFVLLFEHTALGRQIRYRCYMHDYLELSQVSGD